MNAKSSTMARLLTVFILLACVMLDGGAYAQTVKRAVAAPKVKKYASAGVLELGGSASFQMSTAGLVLGLRPLGVGYHKPTTGPEVITVNTFFAPGYHFDIQSNIYPFVEGLVGYTSMSVPDVKGISYGGDVGVKLMLPNRGLLNFSIQYLMVTMNPSGVTTRNGENVLSAGFGYSVWF
jgi:hypothetical protein